MQFHTADFFELELDDLPTQKKLLDYSSTQG